MSHVEPTAHSLTLGIRRRSASNYYLPVEIPTLETERLVLRPLAAADFEAWAEMYADPEFTGSLGYPDPLDRAEAWRMLALVVGHWALRGFGMWAVAERREPARLIGRIGCHQPEGWPDFEVGWGLARPYWGHGYATEGARAALGYAFDVLERPRVISLISPANTRSAAVARRLGERPVERIEFRGKPTDVWALDRSEWRASGRAT
ncbi:MAG: GNAT family N-acetyltransferase [Chloroflexota bacterium]|nr:GNAT family N-acetyltransferase [Chloroflexota bacterium]